MKVRGAHQAEQDGNVHPVPLEPGLLLLNRCALLPQCALSPFPGCPCLLLLLLLLLLPLRL